MSLRINDIAPDFTAQSTEGEIRFHDWIGDDYAIIFSHPKDFTPVCTTEFAAVANLQDEFAKRGTKVIGVSVDPLDSHQKWKADIAQYGGTEVSFPLIADPDLTVAKLYDMIPAETVLPDGRTPAHTATVRSTFFIGPDKNPCGDHLSDDRGAELSGSTPGARRAAPDGWGAAGHARRLETGR